MRQRNGVMAVVHLFVCLNLCRYTCVDCRRACCVISSPYIHLFLIVSQSRLLLSGVVGSGLASITFASSLSRLSALRFQSAGYGEEEGERERQRESKSEIGGETIQKLRRDERRSVNMRRLFFVACSRVQGRSLVQAVAVTRFFGRSCSTTSSLQI